MERQIKYCDLSSRIRLLAILLASSLLIPVRGQELEFQPLFCAKGTITAKSLDKDKKTIYERSQSFSFREDSEGRWKMDEDQSALIRSTKVSSVETISFDGVDIFSALKSDSIVFIGETNEIEVKPSTGSAVGTPGRASSGPFPLDYGPGVGTVWLGFCGGRYLARGMKATNWPDMTCSMARTDPLAWACEFKYELTKGDYPLIQKGDYIVDSSRLRKDPASYPYQMDEPLTEEDYIRFERLITQYEAAIKVYPIRSAFQLDETTNFAGTELPLRFHCVLQPGPAQPNAASWYFWVTLTNFEKGEPIVPYAARIWKDLC